MAMKEEFPFLDSRSGSPDRIWGSEKRNGSPSNEPDGMRTPSLRRARSMSLNEPDGRQSDMTERVRLSRAFKLNGFKGNSRGHSIQGPFATLEQTFKALPQHVGFNIELSKVTLSTARTT
jgi:glycerophosphodiester phosphodiesterase